MVTYFRIKNHGNKPARDIKVSVDDPSQLPAFTVFQHPIPVLTPDDDSLYFFLWAAGCPAGKNFVVTIEYSDFDGNQYRDDQKINFDYIGSTDIGRGNNDPLVVEVRKIREFITRGR